jgi:hypothetical protein
MERRCSIRYKYRSLFRASSLHSSIHNYQQLKISTGKIVVPNGDYDDGSNGCGDNDNDDRSENDVDDCTVDAAIAAVKTPTKRQPRIRPQRHLHAGLPGSWIY